MEDIGIGLAQHRPPFGRRRLDPEAEVGDGREVNEGVAEGERRLDDEALEELEDLLISADLGTAAAARVIDSFRRSRFGKEVTEQEIRDALAEAPPPLDTASRPDLVASILAPVRSGMVVTRADLVRAGEQLGLGVRRGERRFSLEALLDQEPAGTLAWLGRLAGEWVAIHRRSHPGALAPIGRWWAQRASDSAEVLAEAATRVAASSPR